MADLNLLIKPSPEKMSAFNERLKQACHASPITSFSAEVVDGCPAIALLSEMVEADEEMVREAREAGESIELGDPVPAEDPIIVQVMQLGAVGEDAGATESKAQLLSRRAKGEVIDTQIIKGNHVDFVRDRNDLDESGKPRTTAPPKYVTYMREFVYLVVSHYNDGGEAEQQGNCK